MAERAVSWPYTDTSRPQAMRRLLALVLTQGFLDLASQKHRAEAEAFFVSRQLDWIADALGLNPHRIRQHIAEGLDPQQFKYARWPVAARVVAF